MQRIFNSLTFKNLIGRPARSIMLILLSLIMSFTIIAGTLAISGVSGGIDAAEGRLGADIMVLPYQAGSRSTEYTLQGNSGRYYTSINYVPASLNTEGVDKVSYQYVLSTLAASCCDSKVTIYGFVQEGTYKDFTISPWISSKYSVSSLKIGEIIVGADLVLDKGDTFTAYDYELSVVARMDKTDTYLDTAIYASIETIQDIYDSNSSTLSNSGALNPSSYVSSILINVKSGYEIDDVVANLKFSLGYTDTHSNYGYYVIGSDEILSNIGDNLNTVSSIITALIIVIWILSFLIMAVTYTMMINERKKEFAIMRVVGASKSKLSSIVFKEALAINLVGGIIGTLLGSLLVLLFKSSVENMLGLPFVMPDWYIIIIFIIGSILFAAAAGAISSLISTRKINKIDPAYTLREDN